MKNKKIISLFLILVLVLSFFGCKKENDGEQIKNREYDKAQVEEAAKLLLEKSVTVNEILFGRGIEFVEDNSNGIYKKASAYSYRICARLYRLLKAVAHSHRDSGPTYIMQFFCPNVKDLSVSLPKKF